MDKMKLSVCFLYHTGMATSPGNLETHTMIQFDRHLFTLKPTPKTTWPDYAVAILVGLALAVGALEYFDILFY
jgi:hypothetical protein